MDDALNIFRGQSVLVTGHTGFKGAWLVALLNRLGATVTGYSLPAETNPSAFERMEISTLCRSVIGDLRDREKLAATFDSARPRFVFHLAAQTLVRRSYRDPIDTFESNILGTINVLDALRHYADPCVATLITTDKVYAESGTGEPYVESDKFGGHDPYSTSKACCELVAQSYRLSYFNPDKFAAHGKSIATARAGNVIGGGDWCEDRLLPDVVRAMAAGQSVRLRNPRSVRPWQHVLEPLTGYLLLAAKQYADPKTYSDGFNFGPGVNDAVEVERVVQIALNAWGSGTYHIDQDPSAPHEAKLLRLDSSKAKLLLGWRPQWSAEQAIEKTVAWYRHAGDHALPYTWQQIDDYLVPSPGIPG